MTSPLLYEGNASNTLNGGDYQSAITFTTNAISSQIGNFVTVTRTGTGAYTVTLQCPYYVMTKFGSGGQFASGNTLSFVVVSTANLNSSSNPSFTVEARTSAGTATDPASGDKMFMFFTLSNSEGNTSR